MKILVTARFLPEHLAKLSTLGFEVKVSGFGTTGKKLTEEELIHDLIGVQCAILEFEPITERVISESPDLKLIAVCRNEPGANVDVESATKRGLPIISTPGRNAISVAEYTIALMLSISRSTALTHHLLRYTEELTSVEYSDKSGIRQGVTSEWSLEPGAPFQLFQGVELHGRKLGLVGFGAIGQGIARLAGGFGMKIIAYDPFQTSGAFTKYSVESCSLEEVASTSDFVVMAAKVTPETTGMFNSDLFKMMKPTAYFVNTARASLVDYEALTTCLESKSIQGAAIDVYPTEPLEGSSRLRLLDNVVLSPHLAGATHDVVRHHGEMVLSDLQEIIKGSTPQRAVNPEVFANFFVKGGLK